jgi:ABC-2 type transport system permease protein
MRIRAYLKKTFRENLREWKVLSLALVLAPAFVYIMYGYFVAAAPAYNLQVANHDWLASWGDPTSEAAGLIAAWRDAKHPDGKPIFNLTTVTDVEEARARIKSRNADLLVEIPDGFGRALAAFRAGRTASPAAIVNHADDQNLRGGMAMAMSDYVAFSYAAQFTSAPLPLEVSVRPVGSGRPLNDFDLYVPALLVLAIIMILFTAATSLIKEVDKGTMTRLMLSKLRTWELLTAVSINQVLLGLVALTLAYLAAWSCGWRSQGSIFMLLLVGAVTTLGVVAIAVLTSAFLKSMFELLTVGTFPFFILMFFSECMFPLPQIKVLQLGANTLYANDVLPTTLCVRAFNKILNFDGGLADVGFEICAILVLTAGYFALGGWLFFRRHGRSN